MWVINISSATLLTNCSYLKIFMLTNSSQLVDKVFIIYCATTNIYLYKSDV